MKKSRRIANSAQQNEPEDPGQSLSGSALADALFTSTQQRVLALLFGQPNRSFFVTELMSLANSGRGAVQRELGRLAQSGLVTTTKVGNQKHYQANKNSPIYQEVVQIINKTLGISSLLKTALLPLENEIEKEESVWGAIVHEIRMSKAINS